MYAQSLTSKQQGPHKQTMPFEPINQRQTTPTLQTNLLRPAIQGYRDFSYEEIARYTLANTTDDELKKFQRRLQKKLAEMQSIVGAIRRIHNWSPNYTRKYRNEAAIQALEEWHVSLEPFTTSEGLKRISHSDDCKNVHCLKLSISYEVLY